MEFKGTKGKWKLVHSQSKNSWNVIGTVLGGRYKISRSEYIVNTDFSDNINEREKTEQQANALLISKAPEMLEMLKEFVDNCCGEQECEEELIKGLGSTLYNSVLKAKQLIKQATEL